MLIHRAYLRLWEKKISPGVHTQRHILGGSYVGAIERGEACCGCAVSSLLGKRLLCLWRVEAAPQFVEHRLLFVVASLVAEHRPQRVQVSVFVARGLRTCSRWTPEQRLSSSGTRA